MVSAPRWVDAGLSTGAAETYSADAGFRSHLILLYAASRARTRSRNASGAFIWNPHPP